MQKDISSILTRNESLSIKIVEAYTWDVGHGATGSYASLLLEVMLLRLEVTNGELATTLSFRR
ncbi:MAG TPA: hypothetical protein VI033_01715 [Candidatus Nitrosopolaris sp.]